MTTNIKILIFENNLKVKTFFEFNSNEKLFLTNLKLIGLSSNMNNNIKNIIKNKLNNEKYYSVCINDIIVLPYSEENPLLKLSEIKLNLDKINTIYNNIFNINIKYANQIDDWEQTYFSNYIKKSLIEFKNNIFNNFENIIIKNINDTKIVTNNNLLIDNIFNNIINIFEINNIKKLDILKTTLKTEILQNFFIRQIIIIMDIDNNSKNEKLKENKNKIEFCINEIFNYVIMIPIIL